MSYSEQSDDIELLQNLESSPSALEAFYRRHLAEVTRLLASRCRTPEDLADAVSATFLAVLMSARTFNSDLGSPRAWLFSIAINEARGQGRSQGKREGLLLRIRGSALLSQDDSDRLAELIDAERAVSQLEHALRSAPTGERRLLHSMITNDANVAEASRSLGISAATGRKRLERLRGRVFNDDTESMTPNPARSNSSPPEES
ncbi:MAG: RNA polymerase sigma factor [Acidimicrobiales bacterium]|jgi:RNA polymerase sigma-70 factor (ECF subfamily)